MVLSILTILLHNWINDSDMKSILLLATHDCVQCTIYSRLGSKDFCTKTIIVFPTAPVNDTSLIINTKEEIRLLAICTSLESWCKHTKSLKTISFAKCGAKLPPYYVHSLHRVKSATFLKTWKLEERKSTLIRFLNNIILRWSEEGRLGIWVHSTWSCQVKKSLLFWAKGETMEKAGKVDTTGPSPGIVWEPCIWGSVSSFESASKVAQNLSCEFLPLLDDSKKWTKWKWNGQSQRSLWILIRKQWKSWQQSFYIFSK